MKKFKIVVEQELELPDSFSVGQQPEGYPCLKRGEELYEPDIGWMIRKPNIEDVAFRPHQKPGLGWEGVDDDTANEFIQATASQGYRIVQI